MAKKSKAKNANVTNAKVIKNETENEKIVKQVVAADNKVASVILRSIFVTVVVGVVYLLWGNAPIWYEKLTIGMLIVTVFVTFFGLWYIEDNDKVNNYYAIESGISGEMTALRGLEGLPGDYTVIMNPIIKYQGRSNELDAVIVGPNGVFIAEIKNYKGEISGDYSDSSLYRTKTSSGGVERSDYISNPVKQVNAHTYRLANFLREKKIDVFVQPMVCFAHPQTVVDIDNVPRKGVKIFSGYTVIDDMCHFIKSYTGRQNIDKNTRDKIVSLISRQS